MPTSFHDESNKENILSVHLRHLTRKSKPLSPFISKLRFLLNTSKHHDAIHWSTDGRSIVITDIDTFKQSVLDSEGDMFKTRNFTSFVRQLNLYGFRKIPTNGKTDPMTNMRFEHVHFRRERPDLMQLVHRTCLTQKRRFDYPLQKISPTPLTSSCTDTTTSLKSNNTISSSNLSKMVFINQQDKDQSADLPPTKYISSSTMKPKKIPLGVSILQNLKTQTDKKVTTITNSPIIKERLQNLSAPSSKAEEEEKEEKDKERGEKEEMDDRGASLEHNYALPTSTNKDFDEKQIYQFLNQTFSIEKEVVQTLLNLSKPSTENVCIDIGCTEGEHWENNFTDLNILADVSESVLTFSSCDLLPSKRTSKHLAKHY